MIDHLLGLILQVRAALPVKHSTRTKATFYASKFEDRVMANGRKYRSMEYAVSCNLYPLGTLVGIKAGDYEIVARVTDRKRAGSTIDLSVAAYRALGLDEAAGWGWVTIDLVRENR
jgi:rare lipoprotein A (peptidoglycan hydrolase)